MAARILIADDHELVRSAVSQLVSHGPANLPTFVANGQAAIEKAAELKPDLLILDFQMPRRDGLSAGRDIRAFLPNVPVVLYTAFPCEYVECEAKRHGFHGVVQKSNGSALVAAIRSALTAEPEAA